MAGRLATQAFSGCLDSDAPVSKGEVRVTYRQLSRALVHRPMEPSMSARDRRAVSVALLSVGRSAI